MITILLVEVYHGTNDYLVPPSLYIDAWKKVFRNIRKIRMYQNEEHLAFFRNFEQVLLDMAGLDDKTILNTNGHNLIVSENAVDSLLKNGAVRGIVAWANLDKRE